MAQLLNIIKVGNRQPARVSATTGRRRLRPATRRRPCPCGRPISSCSFRDVRRLYPCRFWRNPVLSTLVASEDQRLSEASIRGAGGPPHYPLSAFSPHSANQTFRGRYRQTPLLVSCPLTLATQGKAGWDAETAYCVTHSATPNWRCMRRSVAAAGTCPPFCLGRGIVHGSSASAQTI